MHGVPVWIRTADVAASLVFIASVALGLLDVGHRRLWATTLCVALAATFLFVSISLALRLLVLG